MEPVRVRLLLIWDMDMAVSVWKAKFWGNISYLGLQYRQVGERMSGFTQLLRMNVSAYSITVSQTATAILQRC